MLSTPHDSNKPSASSPSVKKQVIKGSWYEVSETEWQKMEEKQRKERCEFANDEEYAAFLQELLNADTTRTSRRARNTAS